MSEEANKINVYRCQGCGWKAITINRAEGVTPMFIRCEGSGCDSDILPAATSSMYRVPQTLIPTHEWYRPDEEELKAKPYARTHVQQGGLLLRRILKES